MNLFLELETPYEYICVFIFMDLVIVVYTGKLKVNPQSSYNKN